MLSTRSRGPQLFRIFLSVHQQTSALRAGRGGSAGAPFCAQAGVKQADLHEIIVPRLPDMFLGLKMHPGVQPRFIIH